MTSVLQNFSGQFMTIFSIEIIYWETRRSSSLTMKDPLLNLESVMLQAVKRHLEISFLKNSERQSHRKF